MSAQSKLEPIFSYSFPANHLFQVSIVKQDSEQSYKKSYFCFLTLAPGVQSPEGGRSFDFNNRITMKVEGYQVTELAHALRAFARAQEVVLGPFSIFVDSSKSQYGHQGESKSMMIQRTQNQKQNNAPYITLFFKTGRTSALAYSMTPYRALAVADKLEFIGKKCDELEFSNKGQSTVQVGSYENPKIATSDFSEIFANPPLSSEAANKVKNNFTNTFNQFDTDAPF